MRGASSSRDAFPLMDGGGVFSSIIGVTFFLPWPRRRGGFAPDLLERCLIDDDVSSARLSFATRAAIRICRTSSSIDTLPSTSRSAGKSQSIALTRESDRLEILTLGHLTRKIARAFAHSRPSAALTNFCPNMSNYSQLWFCISRPFWPGSACLNRRSVSDADCKKH